MNLQEQITSLVNDKIAGSENFLVEVKVSPAKISVLIDHPKGVKIEDCVSINRFLQDQLETSGALETHELEVGSPGMEEPLKVLKQYHRRIGQKVGVVTFDGQKHIGILRAADDQGITLEEEVTIKTGNKKEKQVQTRQFTFTDIKETRVIFSFDKII